MEDFWQICVLQLKTNKLKNRNSSDRDMTDHIITLINASGPTTEKTTQLPEELAISKMTWQPLAITSRTSTSMILTAWDFNETVGKADDFETCIYRKIDLWSEEWQQNLVKTSSKTLDKTLSIAAKTTINNCGTPPSNTDKST